MNSEQKTTNILNILDGSTFEPYDAIACLNATISASQKLDVKIHSGRIYHNVLRDAHFYWNISDHAPLSYVEFYKLLSISKVDIIAKAISFANRHQRNEWVLPYIQKCVHQSDLLNFLPEFMGEEDYIQFTLSL